MPELTDYYSEPGSPSTPATDPGMFPTLNLFDSTKPFYQPPDGASKSLAQGFADDLKEAFPFFSGVTRPEVKKGDTKVDPAMNWEEGNLTRSPTDAKTKVNPEETGNPFHSESPAPTPKKEEMSVYDAGPPEETGNPFASEEKTSALAPNVKGEAKKAMVNGDVFGAMAMLQAQSKERPQPIPNASPSDVKAMDTSAPAYSGVNPKALSKIAQIESGNDPKQITGSYKGRFQLSDREFQKYNPGGNILDAADNTLAATRKMTAEAQQFEKKYGRPATVLDSYMIHQQGDGGYANHMKNPDAPAWQNMAATGEGRRRGEQWAKQAIWGNIPTKYKAYFRDVNDVSSKDFVNIWAHRLGPGASEPIMQTQVARNGPQGIADRITGRSDQPERPVTNKAVKAEQDLAAENAARHEKDNPTLGGLKTLRNYQVDKQNRDLNNIPEERNI